MSWVVMDGWVVISRQANFFASSPVFVLVENSSHILLAHGVLSSGKAGMRGRDVSLWFRQLFLGCPVDVSVELLYSDDVVELLLLRLTEWLRPPPLLLCRPLCSFAGSP
jgi:hypothetical protein